MAVCTCNCFWAAPLFETLQKVEVEVNKSEDLITNPEPRTKLSCSPVDLCPVGVLDPMLVHRGFQGCLTSWAHQYQRNPLVLVLHLQIFLSFSDTV